MHRIIFISMSLFLFAACGSDLKEVDHDIKEEQLTYEEAIDVNMIYSDSAIVRVSISSPRMLRHLDKENPRQEFLDGIKVTFYSPNHREQSILTAKYAVRYDKTSEVHVRDSVIWASYDGERLETEELIWEERNELLHSNKFVTIQKPDEIIYSYGFEANQDFTEWTLNAVEAEILDPINDDNQ